MIHIKSDTLLTLSPSACGPRTTLRRALASLGALCLALGVQSTLAPAAQAQDAPQKLGTVQELLQPIDAAEQVARRNGWLEAGIAVTLLASFWFLRRMA